MSVREYIGARYVPLFMGDWDVDSTYEPLSIVINEGNSYTSRQFVPSGIDISNEIYWALTGNYNAQIEQYRQEVQSYNNRISNLENELPDFEFDSENTVKDAIESIDDKIGGTYTSENTVSDAIADVDAKIGGTYTSENTVSDAIADVDAKIGGTYTSENTVSDAITDVAQNVATIQDAVTLSANKDLYRWGIIEPELLYDFPLDEHYYCQGMEIVGQHIYIGATIDSDYSGPSYLYKFNLSDGSFVNRLQLSADSSVHANSIAYDENVGVLMVCAGNKITFVDVATFTISHTENYTSYPFSAIACDGTNMAVMLTGNTNMHVYKKAAWLNSYMLSHFGKYRDTAQGYVQDSHMYNLRVYTLLWVRNKNYLDIRAISGCDNSNGFYIDVPETDEIEGISKTDSAWYFCIARADGSNYIATVDTISAGNSAIDNVPSTFAHVYPSPGDIVTDHSKFMFSDNTHMLGMDVEFWLPFDYISNLRGVPILFGGGMAATYTSVFDGEIEVKCWSPGGDRYLYFWYVRDNSNPGRMVIKQVAMNHQGTYYSHNVTGSTKAQIISELSTWAATLSIESNYNLMIKCLGMAITNEVCSKVKYTV